MSRRPFLLSLLPALVVGALAAPPAARAWQTHLQNQYENVIFDVAIGGDGSVIAGGISGLSGDLGSSFVAKLAVDGTVVWRVNVDGYGSRASTVDVDAHGDVLVGGLAGGVDESYSGHFTAVKLAAATGAEIWRYADLDAVDGGMALDAAGDVVAGMTEAIPDQENGGYIVRSFCRKLAGGDGAIQWEHEDCANVVAIDADGNAFTAGFRDVQKIAGSDGHEMWRTAVVPLTTQYPGVGPVAVGASGDAAVAAGSDVTVLAGGDGSVRWHRTFSTFGDIRAIAIDTDGNVAVAGATKVRPTGTDFLVMKLDARQGHRRWRKVLAGRNRDFGYTYDSASAVAFDPSGDVVATGGIGGDGAGAGPLVMKLGARNGRTRWRATLQGSGAIGELAVDATGTIAVAGSLWLPVADPESSAFTVARLGPDGDGATDPPRVF